MNRSKFHKIRVTDETSLCPIVNLKIYFPAAGTYFSVCAHAPFQSRPSFIFARAISSPSQLLFPRLHPHVTLFFVARKTTPQHYHTPRALRTIQQLAQPDREQKISVSRNYRLSAGTIRLHGRNSNKRSPSGKESPRSPSLTTAARGEHCLRARERLAPAEA